jgi:hypothetical protein
VRVDETTRREAESTAALRSSVWWADRLREAFAAVEIPGSLDELATIERASIERLGDLSVFVSDMEEGVGFTPAELRGFAFELLALAEIAAAAVEVTLDSEWELLGLPEAERQVIRIVGEDQPGDGGFLFEYVVVNGRPIAAGGKKKTIQESALRASYEPARER